MTQLEFLQAQHELRRRLQAMEETLDNALLKESEAQTMIDPAVAALIEEFKVATDAIAARIQRLIAAGGLNPESKAALQSEVDLLTAMGQDPEKPVPPQA